MQKMGRYRNPAMKIDSVSNRLAVGCCDLLGPWDSNGKVNYVR